MPRLPLRLRPLTPWRRMRWLLPRPYKCASILARITEKADVRSLLHAICNGGSCVFLSLLVFL